MSQSRRNIKSLFNELDNDIKTTHIQKKSFRITDTFSHGFLKIVQLNPEGFYKTYNTHVKIY